MKLTELLMVTWCSMIVARSEILEDDQETLLKRAAEQLERLAPYRRTAEDRESELAGLLELWKASVDQNQLDGTKSDAEQNLSWKVDSDVPPEQTEQDATKRIDDKKLITIGVLADPRYAALMRDRIKRGFDYGSASLLTSIAGGVLSGVASASSGSAAKASAGSSESAYKPIYGAPTVEHAYSYEEKPFGPWDFKKAIFSTLFQALKAIGGGVLALKGQLVKGGGFLLAGKGKVVTKAGDAITSLGKHLAASVQAKPYPEPYYDHPPIHHLGHDSNYAGPLPNSDEYSEVHSDFGHEAYGVPSDDKGQGGLLIVTPTKSDLDKHNEPHTHVAVQENPDHPATLAENFGGPIKNINNDNNVDSYPPVQHPIYPIAPNDYPAISHNNPTHNYEQDYPAAQDGAYQLPELPQITSHHYHHLSNLDPSLPIQPNVEYPPLQPIQYPGPHNSPLDPPKLPHDDGGTSVYASLSVDTEPQLAPLKVSLLGGGAGDSIGAFDLPKFQPHSVDFHKQPQFTNYLHGSLGGPLRVPLLTPMPSSYYWQGQGSLVPASAFNTLDHFRRGNVLQRRAFAKRFARYASLQRLPSAVRS